MEEIAMKDGDIMLTAYGDISLEFTDDDDIIQMANHSIATIKTENIFHRDYGNDAHNHRLKLSRSGYAMVEGCAKDAILYADPRVEEVTYIKASKGDEYATCDIEYTLTTKDGRILSSMTTINIL